jgi:hypothetical protein
MLKTVCLYGRTQTRASIPCTRACTSPSRASSLPVYLSLSLPPPFLSLTLSLSLSRARALSLSISLSLSRRALSRTLACWRTNRVTYDA